MLSPVPAPVPLPRAGTKAAAGGKVTGRKEVPAPAPPAPPITNFYLPSRKAAAGDGDKGKGREKDKGQERDVSVAAVVDPAVQVVAAQPRQPAQAPVPAPPPAPVPVPPPSVAAEPRAAPLVSTPTTGWLSRGPGSAAVAVKVEQESSPVKSRAPIPASVVPAGAKALSSSAPWPSLRGGDVKVQAGHQSLSGAAGPCGDQGQDHDMYPEEGALSRPRGPVAALASTNHVWLSCSAMRCVCVRERERAACVGCVVAESFAVCD